MKEEGGGRRRQTWHLRGSIQDYLLLRGSELRTEERENQAAAVHIQAELFHGRTGLSIRRLIQELYETLTGLSQDRSLSFSKTPGEDSPEHVKRRLAEAFRCGELVALRQGPARVKKTSGAPQAGAAPPLVPLPLLPEVAPKEKPQKEHPSKEEQDWIAFELVDEQGQPVPGVRYRLTLPDGSERTGTLDARGSALIERIAQGQCAISFPDLDAQAWAMRAP